MHSLLTWMNRLFWTGVIYLFGCGVLSILGAIPAHAALSETQATEVYKLAHKQYGGQLHERPVVHLLEQAKLAEMFGCSNCSPQGLSMEKEIWINEELNFDEPYARSILLHEYIHYLQYMKRGQLTGCEDWLSREQEAYSEQIAMLLREHQDREAKSLTQAAQSYTCR